MVNLLLCDNNLSKWFSSNAYCFIIKSFIIRLSNEGEPYIAKYQRAVGVQLDILRYKAILILITLLENDENEMAQLRNWH